MTNYEKTVLDLNLTLLKEIVKNSKEVQYFSYRTARVLDIIFDFEDYIKLEGLREIEELLLGKVKKRKDNHYCFKVTTEEGNALYFMISDLDFLVGLGIIKENW
ncbi:MAG: hypothetical protein HXK70_02955 [Clostridiales bacterium]|nr:hypothetical protein [Clostridiales bacterium]